MSLDTGPYETDIEMTVKTVIPRVWISEIPDNVPTPETPYAIIYFGGPIRGAGDHHITSTRNDTNISYCTVRVVSSTDTSARDVNNRIRDLLVGYRPTDCGEMYAEGGLTYSNGSGIVKPTKFYRESGYSFRSNLGWT